MSDFEGLIAFYPTQDLQATRVFYETVLGLELVRDQQSCLIFKVTSGGYLGFCHHETPVPNHAGVILTLLTDNVDDVYEKLKALNTNFETPPKHNPRYQIYHFFARDPNAYRLEVQRFDSPLE